MDIIPNFEDILKMLIRCDVEFIIVGGVSAVLQGVPITTLDLDIVHSRSEENIRHLLSALKELDAYYRGHGEKRIRPEDYHLSSTGHHLLMTTAGPLDILGTIGHGYEYEDLRPHSVEMRMDDLNVRVLNLEQLIKVKQEISRDKDKAVLPILQHTLAIRDSESIKYPSPGNKKVP